ncbi:hypothetical protein EII29_06540 [Leptotrichia sp. OH3620_COT-345]|uniref:hypothetical protein n=1 Tax=Leptotrichia sp. OH3620_COT-345 TaxID=2491048 RepID=UPI000F6523DB|nr:hypothetical protein [Leptotrichia sp. OH3620_COT-345]RRD39464.1 hypothetical protein EII29_06540 [Leptotrichia sp. OH3620_COT-345]
MFRKLVTILVFVISILSFTFESKKFNSPEAVIYNTNKKMPANFRFEMQDDNWEDTNYIIHVFKDGEEYKIAYSYLKTDSPKYYDENGYPKLEYITKDFEKVHFTYFSAQPGSYIKDGKKHERITYQSLSFSQLEEFLKEKNARKLEDNLQKRIKEHLLWLDSIAN